jgi:hypothetical protein
MWVSILITTIERLDFRHRNAGKAVAFGYSDGKE